MCRWCTTLKSAASRAAAERLLKAFVFSAVPNSFRWPVALNNMCEAVGVPAYGNGKATVVEI
eukprot:1009549-Lingulodinium_polyedra.AAC.1